MLKGGEKNGMPFSVQVVLERVLSAVLESLNTNSTMSFWKKTPKRHNNWWLWLWFHYLYIKITVFKKSKFSAQYFYFEVPEAWLALVSKPSYGFYFPLDGHGCRLWTQTQLTKETQCWVNQLLVINVYILNIYMTHSFFSFYVIIELL